MSDEEAEGNGSGKGSQKAERKQVYIFNAVEAGSIIFYNTAGFCRVMCPLDLADTGERDTVYKADIVTAGIRQYYIAIPSW